MRNLWARARLAYMTRIPDAVNEDIWTSSAAIHNGASFTAASNTPTGSVAAQQAMLDPAVHPWLTAGTVAPWVPDLLGEEWTHPDAVFVVGLALAGFIKGYSGRRHVIDLKDYLASQTWMAFQKAFLRYVVAGDGDYYERLCPLINHPSRFAIFDIARCALVVRAVPGAKGRRDHNIDLRQANHQVMLPAIRKQST